MPMNVAQKLKLFHALAKCGSGSRSISHRLEHRVRVHPALIEEARIPANRDRPGLVQAQEDLIEQTVESLIGAKRG